jgi:hypothetical protein
MGMGKYQWELFALCGGGWMADNLWLQGVALTLPQLSAEFGVSETEVRYTTLALFLGLCIGASCKSTYYFQAILQLIIFKSGEPRPTLSVVA